MSENNATALAVPISIVNSSGEVLPARGIAKVGAATSADPYGNPRFQVEKPTGDPGLHVVNADCDIPDNGVGIAYRLDQATVVRIGDQTLTLGDEIGPTKDDWSATREGTGLLFVDGPNPAGNAIVVPAGRQMRFRAAMIGALAAPASVMAAPTTGTVAILIRDPSTDQLADSGRRLEVLNYDPSVTAEDGMFLHVEEIQGKWSIYWQSCAADADITGLPETPF